MKLFTLGPVQMFEETLEVRSRQIPYFRTTEFSDIMLENERLIKKRLNSLSDSKIVFLTASGTGAMEATVINCFNQNDRLLILNGGGFGKRFCEICDIHGIAYEAINLKWNEELTSEHLQKIEKPNEFTAFLVNVDETTSGQLYDLECISDFCKINGLLLIVDAISSFGADNIDMDRFGIDACIISSQKAMGLAPGLSIVILSNNIYEKKVLKQPQKTLYFDFKNHIENQKRGQTPFTPAVGILFELNDYLKRISDNKEDSPAILAKYFREKLEQNGFKYPDIPLSNALTPVMLEPDATKYYEILKDRYEMIVTPSGGDLKNVIVRVGHLGKLKKSDYDELIQAMKDIRQEIELKKEG